MAVKKGNTSTKTATQRMKQQLDDKVREELQRREGRERSIKGLEHEKIACSMTDEQFHEVYHELEAIEGLLGLVSPHFVLDEADLPVQIGMRVLSEKVVAAQNLLEAAWDRTDEVRKASHG